MSQRRDAQFELTPFRDAVVQLYCTRYSNSSRDNRPGFSVALNFIGYEAFSNAHWFLTVIYKVAFFFFSFFPPFVFLPDSPRNTEDFTVPHR